MQALGAANVLIKGGHGAGETSSDLLLLAGGQRQRFTAPRHDTRNTHGTGCTLSSAIAAGLASGLALPDAVGHAKTYITAAIAAADQVPVGHGHGPVHHFHHWWDKPDGSSAMTAIPDFATLPYSRACAAGIAPPRRPSPG